MTELEQQLQSQVDKLNDRLKKAADVFRTQKADLQRLTEERDEVQSQLDKSKSTVKELEARLSESADAESNFMQVSEELSQSENKVTELTGQVAGLKDELDKLEALKQAKEDEVTELTDVKTQLEGQLADVQTKLAETTQALTETVEAKDQSERELKVMVEDMYNNFKTTAQEVAKIAKRFDIGKK